MQKSRLVELLQTFAPTDFKSLKKMLRSPFFTNQTRPLQLAECLEKVIFQKKEPSKEVIFEEIFGKIAFDDQQMRLLMSDLLRLVEQFLIYQETSPATAERTQIALAAAYRKRGLGRHFQKSVETATAKQAENPHRDADFHADAHDLEFEQYQMSSARVRTQAMNLPSVRRALDAAFLARRLRLACFAQSHQTVFQSADAEADLLLPILLNYVEINTQLVDYPAIGVYFYCFRALQKGATAEEFEVFKKAILTHRAAFPEEELRNLYLLALNFCIRKMNDGQPVFARQALDLYQSALENRLLLERGQLSRFAFANIVAAALRCDETVWAGQFITENADFLEKKDRSAAVALARARLDFHEKKYGDALEGLQNADFRDLLNHLIAKILMLKIFYETAELDALDAHLRSLEIYLRRHPALGYHREQTGQLIGILKKLLTLRENDRAGKNTLLAEIEGMPQMTEREWVREILNQNSAF
jgi:hypothetical protein